jgi:hypothetical protein
MVTELVPHLKGKEFWIDPRMTNFPRVLASCCPSGNVLCTADQLVDLVHAIGHQGVCSDREIMPAAVANSLMEASSRRPNLGENDDQHNNDPFEETKVGLREFTYTTSKGTSATTGAGSQIKAVGQISFGGSTVLTFPEKSLTVAILVNSLTLDRALSQSVLDVIYEHLGVCPNGDY